MKLVEIEAPKNVVKDHSSPPCYSAAGEKSEVFYHRADDTILYERVTAQDGRVTWFRLT